MAQKVLVIEDNRDMRQTLVTYLTGEGFEVAAYSSTEDGIDAVDENEFDIGLIDINLPGKSGFDMIEYIKDEGHEMPLIALTARDGIEDKLRGFGMGLSDYVVKPFDLQELKARIHAHLKLSGAEDTIKTDNFTLDTSSLEFYAKGRRVELTQLEFRLLELLMRNNKALVKLDDLISYVWGESEDMANPPVRIHIANLRKKIGDSKYEIIRTIPGTGYIFNDPPSGGNA